MKTLITLAIGIAALPAISGEFVNLTFDDPDLSRLTTNPTLPKFGPVEDLLRGWDVALRPSLQDWQPYTGEIEFGTIALFKPVALLSGFGPGNYGVWLNSPLPPMPGQPPPPDIRLSATGTVPLNAVSFDWASFGGTVSIEGDQIFKNALGTDNTLDVSSITGHQVTISFFLNGGGFSPLDVVGFKTVPEPQTWALLGAGVGAVLWWSRKQR